MNNSVIYSLFRFVAVAGNIIIVLWMLYNGMNEGFQGTPLEIASYIAMTGLLFLNTVLLLIRPKT